MAPAKQSAAVAIKIKAACRERDGHKCTLCGITNDEHVSLTGRKLDVHRVVPGSRYSTAPGVCVTICRKCHHTQPRRKRGEPDLVDTGHVGVAMYLRLTEGQYESLLAFISAQRIPPRMSAVVAVALDEFLRREGHLPPKA